MIRYRLLEAILKSFFLAMMIYAPSLVLVTGLLDIKYGFIPLEVFWWVFLGLPSAIYIVIFIHLYSTRYNPNSIMNGGGTSYEE
jgi:hypothetical protein